MPVLLALLSAYVLGSLPTSYLAGRLFAGIDLRQHGSKNLGATNVFRVLGARYAVPVLIIDAAKGTVAAVFISRFAGPQPWMPLLLGSTAVLGHVYPIFLGFKGGKGVATAAGVMLGVAPVAIGICIVLWLLIVLTSGYVSLGSVLASASFPIVIRAVSPRAWYEFFAGLGLASLIVYTHRANIRRLIAGTEPRFSSRQKKEA